MHSDIALLRARFSDFRSKKVWPDSAMALLLIKGARIIENTSGMPPKHAPSGVRFTSVDEWASHINSHPALEHQGHTGPIMIADSRMRSRATRLFALRLLEVALAEVGFSLVDVVFVRAADMREIWVCPTNHENQRLLDDFGDFHMSVEDALIKMPIFGQLGFDKVFIVPDRWGPLISTAIDLVTRETIARIEAVLSASTNPKQEILFDEDWQWAWGVENDGRIVHRNEVDELTPEVLFRAPEDAVAHVHAYLADFGAHIPEKDIENCVSEIRDAYQRCKDSEVFWDWARRSLIRIRI